MIGFFALVVFLGIGAYIADEFFDYAASIDSCADSGGVWNDDQEQCSYDPTQQIIINKKNVEQWCIIEIPKTLLVNDVFFEGWLIKQSDISRVFKSPSQVLW